MSARRSSLHPVSLCMLVSVVSWPSLSGSSLEALDFHWEVSGTGYAGDRRLPMLRRQVSGAARASWRRLSEELRLFEGREEEVQVRWVLDLSAVRSEPPAPGLEPAAFFEGGRTSFHEGSVVVTLPARKYLAEPEAALKVVAHESAHAYLAWVLGSRQRYEALPRWLREGFALRFSGEGDLELEEQVACVVFAGGFHGPAADSFLAGIPALSSPGDETKDGVSRAEAYLAVRCIEARAGMPGLREIIELARRSRPFEESIREVLGMSLAKLRLALLVDARKQVRELLASDVEREFRESLRLREERKSGEAANMWRKLLASGRSGPLASTLRYLAAREALHSSAAPSQALEARKHLEDLLGRPGSLWRAEALVLLGDCCLEAGELDHARAAWGKVLEAFGEDRLPASQAAERLRRLEADC